MSNTGFAWLDQKADEATKNLATKTESPVIEVTQAESATVLGYFGQVSMDRALVKAAHGLNLNQKRLMMYAISELHPKAVQPTQVVVRIGATDYAKSVNVTKSKNFYRDLKNSADALFKRYISIEYDTPKGREIAKVHWVSAARYHEGEGWVELRFTPEVSPYLTQLNSGNQVIYNLEDAVDLKSVYSWRLLELLYQWQDSKQLYIKLEDFRHALEIPEKYRYADIKINCIERVIKDLKQNAKIVVTYEAIKDPKNKRRVGSLRFRWKEIEQRELPLKGGETTKTK